MKKFVLKRYLSVAIMESRFGVNGCAFNKLFKTNVPHVLEMIFFSLDYESYKKCLKVCFKWRELLSTTSFPAQVKLLFRNEIAKDQLMLSSATWNGYAEIAKSLLSSGLLDVNANISMGLNNIISRTAGTLLTLAAEEGHEEVVLLLLDNGADINKPNIMGSTPLNQAVTYRRIGVVKHLLIRGALPDKANNTGRTPLHSAVSSGTLSIVQLLLDSGATSDIQDDFGWTPMQMAKVLWNDKIMELLKKYQNVKPKSDA